jgi:general secretion pathway protein G
MRQAFTMIELIFVIVIIGILAAVAIPKLSATSDDARHSQLMANARTCVNDLIAGYKGSGNTLNIDSVLSCKKAKDAGAEISYTNDSVRVSGVDKTIDKDYIFKGTLVSL